MSTGPKQVGLFGGSFNPPHICHLLSSVHCLETTDLEAVWWLPVCRHAFDKDRELVPFAHRLEMCRRATAGYTGIEVCDAEEEAAERSYTIDLLERLQAQHPDTDFTWILGSDIVEELPLWHRWTELRNRIRFLVVGRGDGSLGENLPEGASFLLRNFHLPDLSSSAIREALASDRPVDSWLPGGVRQYLDEHPDLYGG